MTYRERQRLADIQAAIDAIRSHLQRGDLPDGLIFDAIRIRLLEISEAVKPFTRRRRPAPEPRCYLMWCSGKGSLRLIWATCQSSATAFSIAEKLTRFCSRRTDGA